MKPVQTIAVAVVEANDHFLVGVRPAGSPLAGYREFPGGKVHVGESFEEAAARETAEEAGLAVRITTSILWQEFEYEHATVLLHFFAATPLDWSAKQPLPPVAAPFAWIPRSELKHCRFPDGNRKLLEKLRRLP